jgi:hypothetical protein
MRGTRAVLLGMALLGAGCYHATVETGATPSTETVEKAWASSWIYGLVPPAIVSTAQKCTSGVARVETQLPFVNMLVGVLTFGIYTPMSIKVTCAARRTASADEPVIRVGVDAATPEEAIVEAVALSRKLQRPVDVEY